MDQEDPLEEGIITHSSILAWRIPMDRGAWPITVHELAKSQTRLKRLSMHSTILPTKHNIPKRVPAHIVQVKILLPPLTSFVNMPLSSLWASAFLPEK